MSTDVKETVRRKYGEAARQVAVGGKSSCCSSTCCGGTAEDPITSNLYSSSETATLPGNARGVTVRSSPSWRMR